MILLVLFCRGGDSVLGTVVAFEAVVAMVAVRFFGMQAVCRPARVSGLVHAFGFRAVGWVDGFDGLFVD